MQYLFLFLIIILVSNSTFFWCFSNFHSTVCVSVCVCISPHPFTLSLSMSLETASGGILCVAYSWFKNLQSCWLFSVWSIHSPSAPPHFLLLTQYPQMDAKGPPNPACLPLNANLFLFNDTPSQPSHWQFCFCSCSSQNLNMVLDSSFPCFSSSLWGNHAAPPS